MTNRGKIFENKFAEDWKTSFPDTFIFRLYDNTGGYLGISNPCDFLCFTGSELYMVECKSHDGSSIPFTAMSQYERMLAYKGMKNVHPGFVIWFKEKDIVIWVSIEVAEQIYQDGNKSIQLKMIDKNLYDIKVLPSEKKRIYLSVDYSILPSYYGGKDAITSIT